MTVVATEVLIGFNSTNLVSGLGTGRAIVVDLGSTFTGTIGLETTGAGFAAGADAVLEAADPGFTGIVPGLAPVTGLEKETPGLVGPPVLAEGLPAVAFEGACADFKGAADLVATGARLFLAATTAFAGGVPFLGASTCFTAALGADLAPAPFAATGDLAETAFTELLLATALTGTAFLGAAFLGATLAGAAFFAALATGFAGAFLAGAFLTGCGAFLADLAAFFTVAMLRSFFGNDYF